MKIAVLTDSNSGIFPEEEAQREGLFVLPMPVIIDGEENLENVSINQEQFYQKLKSGADVSTSMPAIGLVVEKWEELLKEYDQIVHIPMSSSLSMSCEAALNFSKEYEGKVFVVDNQRISVTQKRSVFDALELVKEGKNGAQIKEILENAKKESSIYILVDTLKYLKKGGRITPAAAAIGTLLRIKPVLQIQGGKLDQFAKVMNEKVARQKMIDAMKKDLAERFADFVEAGQMELYVAYTNCRERAEAFAEQIRAEIPFVPVTMIDPLPLSIACHIGDGAIAIACARKMERK